VLHARITAMQTGCFLSIGLLLVATVFLFIFANPIGWVFAGIFAVVAFIVAVMKAIDWQRIRSKVPSHKHGPEDLGRGPDDDPMTK
jgi:uncharacterized membrane protein SirB2